MEILLCKLLNRQHLEAAEPFLDSLSCDTMIQKRISLLLLRGCCAGEGDEHRRCCPLPGLHFCSALPEGLLCGWTLLCCSQGLQGGAIEPRPHKTTGAALRYRNILASCLLGLKRLRCKFPTELSPSQGAKLWAPSMLTSWQCHVLAAFLFLSLSPLS